MNNNEKVSAMSGKERIMAVLEGRKADRVSWAPLIDPYFTTSLPEQNLPEMDEIDALRYIGADIILRHVPTYLEVFDDTVKWIDSEHDGTQRRTASTPVGDISIEHKRNGKTLFETKHFVETIEDLRVMKYVLEHMSYKENFDAFLPVAERIGDDGIATVSVPLTPLQKLLQFDAGIANFTYLFFDYEDEVRDFLDVAHKKNLEAYRLVASAPEHIKVAISYEDTSTTVMSPAWFEEFCVDHLNEYADILHGGNKIFIAHMCGKLTGMLDSLKKCRFDGIDSVCPPTTGDLEAIDALSALPGKFIIGGIEPPALQRMSVDETYAYAKKVLDACSAESGRLILCTGDATPYATPVENLKVIAELVKE